MADQYDMAQQKAKKKQQGGFFSSMSTLQKAILIIIGIALFFLIWTLVFGGIQNFYQLAFFGISFIVLAGLFYVVMTAIAWYLAPEFYSPKKDYFTRLVNLAIDSKPPNVHNLYFRGNKDKRAYKAGRIVGLLGIPYYIGDKEMDEKGKPKLEYSKTLKRDIPVYKSIKANWEDGDTFIIYESGWLIKKRHFLRCHKSLHGDLNGDVYIYDINPVPYGSLYEYPFRQLQRDPSRVMIQNQLEVILATHEHQYDLISQGVDSAVYFNPYFRMKEKENAEMRAE